MMTWYLLYFLIFLAGTVAALALTPCFRALAVRCDLMDRPRSEPLLQKSRSTAFNEAGSKGQLAHRRLG